MLVRPELHNHRIRFSSRLPLMLVIISINRWNHHSHLPRSFRPKHIRLIQHRRHLLSNLPLISLLFLPRVIAIIIHFKLCPHEIRPYFTKEPFPLSLQIIRVKRDHVVRCFVPTSFLATKQEPIPFWKFEDVLGVEKVEPGFIPADCAFDGADFFWNRAHEKFLEFLKFGEWRD